MEITTALSTASTALKLVKDLRDIERDLDSASYKAKMAELYGSLAEVKMALADAQIEIRELNEQIDVLRAGEACPICDNGKMKVTASRAHPQLSFAGVQERTITCDNSECKHSEERNYDPRK
jgi:DNA repair exonuclease SbcCD ATPase subunit